jgi:hypothetical protein
MLEPQLEGDTVVGMVDGEPERIPLAETTAIRAREPAPLRTAAVVILAGAATFGGLWYMEHRPDVGDAQVCTNGVLDMGVSPGSQYIPCCLVLGTNPC